MAVMDGAVANVAGQSLSFAANALAVTIYKRPHVGYESSGVSGLMNSRH
ncbi:MAG: hypothetical protein WA820_06810 [Bradyrhizobium sp.]|jgi:hypothetical protein